MFTFFKILCTLNAKNCVHPSKNGIRSYVHSSKNCVHWMYIFEKIVYFECKKLKKLCVLNIQNCVHWIYTIFYIIQRLCTLNVLNYVCWLKICVHRMYKIEKVCISNIQNFVHWICIMLYITSKIEYVEYTLLCILSEREMICPQHFHNIFTTNPKWQVVTGCYY